MPNPEVGNKVGNIINSPSNPQNRDIGRKAAEAATGETAPNFFNKSGDFNKLREIVDEINNNEGLLRKLQDEHKERLTEMDTIIEQLEEELRKTKEKAKKNGGAKRLLTSILIGAFATAALGGAAWYGKSLNKNAQTPAPDQEPQTEWNSQTPEANEFSANSYMMAPNGYVMTSEGEYIQKFEYQGGYHAEADPYSTKFERQGYPDYENDEAYGLEIEGESKAEITSNWIKRVMLSPEATVRLRVQMGLENLDSIEAENVRADQLRNVDPSEYDHIVNETANAFYDRIEGGEIRESHDWTLENYMRDQYPNSHFDSEVSGRLNSDDETGKGQDLLLTYFDANGNNIVSNRQGFLNTARDANAENRNINQRAWVNMDEGGTWKWKAGAAGAKQEKAKPTKHDTPGDTPGDNPGDNPGDTPGDTPGDNPGDTPGDNPGNTPEVTPEVTPGNTPEVTPEVTPGNTPEVTPEVTPGNTPEVTPEVTPGNTPGNTPEVTPEATPQPKDQAEADENSGADVSIVTPEKQERQITGEPTPSDNNEYNPDTNTYNYTPEEQAEKIGYITEDLENGSFVDYDQDKAPIVDEKRVDAGDLDSEEPISKPEDEIKEAPAMVTGTQEGATGEAGTANDFNAGATVGTGEVTGDTQSADGSGNTVQESLDNATGNPETNPSGNYNEGF